MTLDLHDRIPVILDQRGFSEWLDEGAVAARIDLGEQVHLIPVSLKMHNSKYHAEDCIIPLTEPPDAPSCMASYRPSVSDRAVFAAFAAPRSGTMHGLEHRAGPEESKPCSHRHSGAVSI